MTNWKVGDLALRVKPANPSPKFPPPLGHRKTVQGGIYTVEGIAYDGLGNLGLILEGCHTTHPNGPAVMASAFRKIEPHKPDQEDRETIDLMRSLRPKVGA